MTAIRSRVRSWVHQLAALLPTPPRQPTKECADCGTKNEPWRTSCIGCGVKF